MYTPPLTGINLLSSIAHILLRLPLPSPSPPPLIAMPPPRREDPNAEEILKSYQSALPPGAEEEEEEEKLTDRDRALLHSFLLTLCHAPDSPVPVRSLLTTSAPLSYHAGDGLTSTRALARAILRAKREVLLVTCFWARSDSRDVVCAALRELSARALARGRVVRVRVCFSSLSAWQKVAQRGGTKVWERLEDVGLPGRGEVRGLEIVAKSVFFRPFSVLHGKYCVVDRAWVGIGSGNVSWECWGEGVGGFAGGEGLVGSLLGYYKGVWEDDGVLPCLPPLSTSEEEEEEEEEEEDPDALEEIRQYPTIFLPNPHHRNPHFSFRLSVQSLASLLLPCFFAIPPSLFFSSSSHAPPPNTPQNAFLLTLISHAQACITIHTPNLTCIPLLSALLSAAARGVHITIITCRNMMRLEQLATTPFSTTESCVSRFISALPDAEAGAGKVHLGYWRGEGDVKQWHVKASIVDHRWTVIGSANGDRASWWGSGETNVCVIGEGYAKAVAGRLERWAVKAGGVEWVIGGRELGV